MEVRGLGSVSKGGARLPWGFSLSSSNLVTPPDAKESVLEVDWFCSSLPCVSPSLSVGSADAELLGWSCSVVEVWRGASLASDPLSEELRWPSSSWLTVGIGFRRVDRVDMLVLTSRFEKQPNVVQYYSVKG